MTFFSELWLIVTLIFYQVFALFCLTIALVSYEIFQANFTLTIWYRFFSLLYLMLKLSKFHSVCSLLRLSFRLWYSNAYFSLPFVCYVIIPYTYDRFSLLFDDRVYMLRENWKPDHGDVNRGSILSFDATLPTFYHF